MPELPEVETVRRGLAPVMEGARIAAVEVRRANLRFPFPAKFAERLEGRTVTAMGRRAKYLTVDLDDGMVLIMHLGMSGSFRIEMEAENSQPGVFHHDRSKKPAHDHVVFHLERAGSGKARVTYNDPRRFGFMDLIPRSTFDLHPLFCDLGIEPTGNALSEDYLAACFAGKRTPLKAALLDQKLIAGLGNIYVCEALHGAGLSPKRLAGSLTRKNGTPSKRLRPLAAEIRRVIARAIEAGGSSLRDHRQADGSLGYFQHQFSVYGREGEPCPKRDCEGTVRRMVQSGRSTFYCPACQR
ncbi:bifunctional DNA-formamidopyrimidine glycosylase/DNA-(apurinic or apyrimidinic site) lyase [Salaquimonas pukyongi]|uniref:bifunctional DNA-formamidopyrimidine glycosylase/DNA-(apurinic or apyrimidinic site) lyase n=1 Tax=Salaquimonas pukyongi TaxID=2712698 RepID=UPI00096BCC34|nr:bifunctional DNA-formamidopyrimidine glycosylase/DNA-(apurinic or apyrimidinic site) lyase [Salaquimonas pukyongi]